MNHSLATESFSRSVCRQLDILIHKGLERSAGFYFDVLSVLDQSDWSKEDCERDRGAGLVFALLTFVCAQADSGVANLNVLQPDI